MSHFSAWLPLGRDERKEQQLMIKKSLHYTVYTILYIRCKYIIDFTL
ncbi:hypothetical protein AW19_4157 (plasmid) [Yersinia frederiksenii Y225]|nr:hypothetical protein AW19_4157 [Yersinia frederiksenii Y225]